MRTAQLPTHLHGFHPELVGSIVKSHSNVLKPVHAPFVPKPGPPLPPLPSGQFSLHDLDPLPVRKANYKRKRDQSPSQSLGPKWSRLNARDENDNEPEVLELDNLSRFDSEIDEVRNIIVRRKPPEKTRMRLSCAHRMVYPPPSDIDPPISILFDPFAQKVDDMRARGLL